MGVVEQSVVAGYSAALDPALGKDANCRGANLGCFRTTQNLAERVRDLGGLRGEWLGVDPERIEDPHGFKPIALVIEFVVAETIDPLLQCRQYLFPAALLEHPLGLLAGPLLGGFQLLQ